MCSSLGGPQKEYASEVTERLSSLGLYADVDNGENTLQKKIRNGELARYNFILGMLIEQYVYSGSILTGVMFFFYKS